MRNARGYLKKIRCKRKTPLLGDVTCYGIRECRINGVVSELHVAGCEKDVLIEEISGRNFDSIIIGASIDSEIGQDFARSLADIRRVIVDGWEKKGTRR